MTGPGDPPPAEVPSTGRVLVEAARPRTLPAAVAPVLVGTAAVGAVSLVRAALAAVVALAVQVAVNFANDRSDGLRGVDTAERVGPRRAVASGLISSRSMGVAVLGAMAVSAAAGIALAAMTTWWLVAVGAVCFVAALGYSGGPRPYASAGLGEVFVFVFFGLVATVGSAFVQVERIDGVAVVAAIPVGLWAVALLVVNNLRDIETDTVAAKRTLAVRLGAGGTRALYVACVLGALAGVVGLVSVTGSAWPLLGLVAVPFAVLPVRSVLAGSIGPPLIQVLGDTARAQLVWAVATATGLIVGAPAPEGVVAP